MHFIVGEGALDEKLIEQCLKSLSEGEGENRYAILVDDKDPANGEFYIQVLGTPDGDEEGEYGFVLEHREGSRDKHYQCFTVSSGSRGLDEVTQAFIGYFHSNEKWKTPFDWENNLVD